MEENLFRNKNWLIVQFNIVISLLETLLSVLNIKEYQIRITSEMKRFNFLRGHNKLVFQTRVRNFFVFNIREVSEFVFVWKTCFFGGTSIFCLESWLFFQVSVRNIFFVWRFFFFFFCECEKFFYIFGASVFLLEEAREMPYLLLSNSKTLEKKCCENDLDFPCKTLWIETFHPHNFQLC